MRILLAVLFIGFSGFLYSHMDSIKLKNPSFEDTPRKGGVTKGIKGWYDYGLINFPEESAPDIHPGGSWGVDDEPYDGETYLGLVVRDNDTWESVSQKLSVEDGTMTPMLGGNCYRMTMAVLRAEKYISGSRFNHEISGDKSQTYNYTTPVVVRIWEGNGYCHKKELLATSDPVVNSEWEAIEFGFTPADDYTFFTIEAFFELPAVLAYNGHVLIDDLSEIMQIACKD